jgi:2-(1,2-epoxy-1,2-dihydrophenyl)acetyl-CoA isomerase
MDTDVLYEKRDDGVAIITMNRPERLNAMGEDLVPLLGRYTQEAAADDGVRCVVLTGAGRGFCAGADQRLPPGSDVVGGGELQGPQSLMRIPYLLHTMPKPTVAMINGATAGGGMGLALACDIRIASAQAKFTSAFRNVGLAGDFGLSYFLVKSIGYNRAIELGYTADLITAQRALELGIVNRVLPHDRLVEKTLAFAAWLAAGPSYALARMKDTFVTAAGSDARTTLLLESSNQLLSASRRAAGQGRALGEGRRPEPFNWDDVPAGV